MSQILPQLINKNLANNSHSISDYEFFKFINFIKEDKSSLALDLLLIAFTSIYNNYLEQMNTIENNNKESIDKLLTRCKELTSILNEFNGDVITTFIGDIKNLVETLFTNNDEKLSINFLEVLSQFEPLFCLKILKKYRKNLDDKLLSIYEKLEEDYENYKNLSFEVEQLINKNISDLNYDFPIFNYLDFI